MRKSLRFIVFIFFIVSISSIIYACYYVFLRPYENTNNAYIGANYTTIAARISGPVIKTYVVNNQKVKYGDLLFEIDPSYYTLAVDRAQANLDIISKNVAEGEANINKIEAIIKQRESALQKEVKNSKRIDDLTKQGITTDQEKDNAIAALDDAKYSRIATIAELTQAKVKLETYKEGIKIAQTELEKAKLDLEYTKIYAPISGQISNYSIYPGQYLNAGITTFAIISDQAFWVDANFKETQIANMYIGQKVLVEIDMYPDKKFSGEIISIGGATGTVFSLLPPQNATGNWIKVTQRIPVRIKILNPDPKYPLRVGSSAYVSIRVME